MFMRAILSVVFFLGFIHIAPAFAYVDPNTGGFFFQTVAPFIYGILGVIVVFWKRIIGYAKNLFGRKKDQESSSNDL